MRPPGLKTLALAMGTGGLLFGTLVVLVCFDPEQCSFYPRCPFHALTGLACPGCGALRAVHQLLHGNLLAALHLNALVVLAVPGMAWVGARCLVLPRTDYGRFWTGLVRRPVYGWLALAGLVSFGILRNLPLAPFSGLAP